MFNSGTENWFETQSNISVWIYFSLTSILIYRHKYIYDIYSIVFISSYPTNSVRTMSNQKVQHLTHFGTFCFTVKVTFQHRVLTINRVFLSRNFSNSLKIFFYQNRSLDLLHKKHRTHQNKLFPQFPPTQNNFLSFQTTIKHKHFQQHKQDFPSTSTFHSKSNDFTNRKSYLNHCNDINQSIQFQSKKIK